MRRQLRAAHSEHAEAPSGSGTLLSGYRPSGEAVDVVLHAESVVASRQKPSLSDINRPVDPAIRSSAVHSLHVVRIAWPVNEVGVSAIGLLGSSCRSVRQADWVRRAVLRVLGAAVRE